MTNKLLVGQHITKYYGTATEQVNVLDDVSIEMNEGEFVSVMGPSGSGKSTLMFALSGMDRIDSGKINFLGRDISSLKENELADMRRTEMGFIFQQPTLLKNLNVLDNIILPSIRNSRKNNEKIVQKAKTLMKTVGIAGLEQRNITEMSGGQLQRVGICRALINSPRILFGDEPTGALNVQTAKEILELLADINGQGTAIILVTHDAIVAAKTQRVMFMCDGKIVSEMLLPKFNGSNLDQRVSQITSKMREIGI